MATSYNHTRLTFRFLGFTACCALAVVIAKRIIAIRKRVDTNESGLAQQLKTVEKIAHSLALPAALVDLDAFDHNVKAMVDGIIDSSHGLEVRIATKSVRSQALLYRMAAAIPNNKLSGFMTFTASETLQLVKSHQSKESLTKAILLNHRSEHENTGINKRKHSHFLIAYPIAEEGACHQAVQAHATLDALAKGQSDYNCTPFGIAVMVDCVAHVDIILDAVKNHFQVSNATSFSTPFAIWFDLDMSYRPMGSNKVHLGVRRSPLRTTDQIEKLGEYTCKLIKLRGLNSQVIIGGLMGYESQIAGLPDFRGRIEQKSLIANATESIFRSAMKYLSVHDGFQRRLKAMNKLSVICKRNNQSHSLLCNGGGSGSIFVTAKDVSISEATIGSGALCGHLFDSYLPEQAPCYRPALFFALRVTRNPAQNIYTCHGGGWVASGEAGKSRLPLLVYPPSASLIPLEATGEVQTPIVYSGSNCEIPTWGVGSVALFRPCKSGELGEVFCNYTTLCDDETATVTTYRGQGITAWEYSLPEM